MRSILSLATLLAAVTIPVLAQQQTPKPKSQKEVDALKKVQADAQAGNVGPGDNGYQCGAREFRRYRV